MFVIVGLYSGSLDEGDGVIIKDGAKVACAGFGLNHFAISIRVFNPKFIGILVVKKKNTIPIC